MTTWKKVQRAIPKSAVAIAQKIVRGWPSMIAETDDWIHITTIGVDSCCEFNLREFGEAFNKLPWVDKVEIVTVDRTLAAAIGCRSYATYSLKLA